VRVLKSSKTCSSTASVCSRASLTRRLEKASLQKFFDNSSGESIIFFSSSTIRQKDLHETLFI
jgi:hypothetical protein